MNPLNAEYTDPALRQELNEAGIDSLEAAVRLNPARGIYWYELGKRYSFRSYDPSGYPDKWLPLAEDCFDTAIRCAPRDAAILFDTAWYWVWRSSVLPEEPEDGGRMTDDSKSRRTIELREDGIRKFQELFQRSLEIRSNRWKQAVDRVWEYYPDKAVVVGILPPDDQALRGKVMKYLIKKQRPKNEGKK